MFEFSFRGPAVISYGLGLLAFLAFSVHLGLGWRGGLRASVLLATIAISALWAAVAVGFALTDASAFWIGQTIFDALRIGGWLLFMALLLSGRPAARTVRLEATRTSADKALQGGEEPISFHRGAWWAVAFLALPAVTWFLPPSPPVGELVSAATPSRLPYGFLLGVSVMGLVLAEQIFRRAREQARWSIKPL